MKASWLYATLLLFSLCGCARCKNNCKCKDNIPEVQHVAVNMSFSVPCPTATAEEMQFILQGPKFNVTITLFYNNTSPRTSNGSRVNASLCVNTADRATCFVVYDANEDETGLYTCRAIKTFPPPMANIKEEPKTIVIVGGRRCEPDISTPSTLSSHLLLSLGLGVLFIYSLIITYIVLSLRCRLKKKTSTSHDYMNMKPRTRRRRQGVLHPTRLSWYRETNTSMAVNKHPPSRTMA